LLEYLGVKRRAVGGDAAHRQAAVVQLGLELLQESQDVLARRLVVQNAEGEAAIPAVVYHGQNTEGAVVELVNGQVAAKVSQGTVQVAAPEVLQLFFPRLPRPSSGWWRRGRRPGGHARGASWRPGRAGRPRRPGGRPAAGPGGCTGTWAVPGRSSRRRS